MKRLYSLFYLLFLLCTTAFGQIVSVSGVVTSTEDGFGLPGVTIRVKTLQKVP